MTNYDHEFYGELKNTARPSADVIVPLVLEHLDVRSVVDVGCGAGWWLEAFRAHGVEDVLGLEGNWIEADQVVLPPEVFVRRQLEGKLDLDRTFDLAMSLEVAEHLSEAAGPGFVDQLCALAPVVLFSAAIPSQGGPGHINEQWPTYWAGHFARNGYRPVDAVRMHVWDDGRVSWWYRQNVLLFASDAAIAENSWLAENAARTGDTPADLVHPALHHEMARRANVRWQVALSRSVRRKIKGVFGAS